MRASSLASFVGELVLAWQRLALYQEGHPIRQDAMQRAHSKLKALVGPTGSLTFGVTRTELVGPDGPLTSVAAQKLAEGLHLHGVALVRVEEGVRPAELEEVLVALSGQKSDVHEQPIWERLASRGVRHVHLEAADFAELLTDGEADEAGRETLWGRILERLLTADQTAVFDAGAFARDRSLDEVIQAIQELLSRYRIVVRDGEIQGEVDPFADQVLRTLVDVLTDATALHLESDPTVAGRMASVTEIAELLGAVPARIRTQVVEAALRVLCAEGAVRDGLDHLLASTSPLEILEALRRLRGAEFDFSPAALRLLEPTIRKGERAFQAKALGDRDALAELEACFGDRDVDLYQPPVEPPLRATVRLHPEPVLAPSSPDIESRLGSLDEQKQQLQLASALFEMLQRAVFDPTQAEAIARRLEELVRTLIATGRISSALRIGNSIRGLAGAAQLAPAVQRAAAESFQRLQGAETVEAIVQSLSGLSETAATQLRGMLAEGSPSLLQGLVLALGEEEDRARRRRIFDFLAGLGPIVARPAASLLSDSRWFVVRNMLALLHQTGGGLTEAMLMQTLGNPDHRVRLESVKSLSGLGAPPSVELLGQAIWDEDARVAEAAVTSVGSHRFAQGLKPLLKLVLEGPTGAAHRPLRIKAIGAIGQLGDPAALEALKPFFGGWFSAVNAEERRAAFASLIHYPVEARAPIVARGSRSPDGEVRALCDRLKARKDSPADGGGSR